MGYTNYFTKNKKATASQWNQLIDDAKLIFEKANEQGIELTGCGLGPVPIADKKKKMIFFNGTTENDLCHETFSLQKNQDSMWDFCKTARKPYDAVVKAILIRAEELGVVSKWSFDGDKDEEEYEDGVNLLISSLVDKKVLDSQVSPV